MQIFVDTCSLLRHIDDMSNDYKYTIQAYSSYAVEQCNGQVQHISGYDADREADSLKEAKRIARYLLSEDYRRLGEMSEALAYAQIIETKSGDCVHDEWRKGYELPIIAEEVE